MTPIFKIDVGGLSESDTALRKFAAGVLDFRPFWRLLGKTLADESQARWPLRRRSGRLRKSLVWAGSRLGPRGIFESLPDRLRYGSSIFYGRFHQHGAKNTPRRPLIYIDPEQHTEQLSAWLRDRAARAGVEVET